MDKIQRLEEIVEGDKAYNKCLMVWDYSNLSEILQEIHLLGKLGVPKDELIEHLQKLI